MVDTIERHLFDDEYVIIKFNHTSCVCLSCYLQKELVSIVGSYCTLSLKSLVATLQRQQWLTGQDLTFDLCGSSSVWKNLVQNQH